MIPRDVHFGWPEGAYLVLASFVFAAMFWRLYEYRKKVLSGFLSLPAVSKVIVLRSRVYYFVASAALTGAWACAAFALMQPEGQGRYGIRSLAGNSPGSTLSSDEANKEVTVLLRRKAHDVIFLIDASASMEVKDTRTGVSRLDYAKEIVEEIISHLDGQAVVLYAFTSDLSPVVPPTMDYLFTRMMLRRIEVNEGGAAGTDLLETLGSLRQRHFTLDKGLKTVILLSDGGDTLLDTTQGEKRQKEQDAILSRLEGSEGRHVRFFTVGIGSKEGVVLPNVLYEGQAVKSSLDEELLIKLSEKGRGHYYFANNYSSLAIAEDIASVMKQDAPFEETEQKTQKVNNAAAQDERQEREAIYDLYYQIPLALAILLLALALWMPEVRKNKVKT